MKDPLDELVEDLFDVAVDKMVKNGRAQITVDDVMVELGGIYDESAAKKALQRACDLRKNASMEGNVVTLVSAIK